jgi:endonuclease YncB( thermonuclease family)
MDKKSKFPLSYVVVFVLALGAFLWWSRPSASSVVPLSRSVAYHSSTLQAARVHAIIDGETLQVVVNDTKTGPRSFKITLYGVDAPKQPHAGTARDYLESVVSPGTGVEIDLKGRDPQGRVSAVVVLRDGRDAACAMLESGWARIAPMNTDDRLASIYDEAQKLAQSAHRGLWK